MDFPNRKQVRLAAYDYSAPGAYFVTVCTQDRRCILSHIAVGADAPSAIGAWKRLVHREAGQTVFQRSYHEPVIRGEADYREIWNYIDTNPAKWAEDRVYTA